MHHVTEKHSAFDNRRILIDSEESRNHMVAYKTAHLIEWYGKGTVSCEFLDSHTDRNAIMKSESIPQEPALCLSLS